MYLYQSSLIKTKLSENHFELSYWQGNEQSILLEGGRGASQKIVLDQKPYVLRRYLRGGLMAKLSYDAYVYGGERNTRPYQEQRVLEYAKHKGLPVPNCVAYYISRQGLFYRAAIITEFLANEGTLASYLETNELNQQHWQTLSLVIKHMHVAHINHADLNANNILVHKTKEGELSFSLIDFDKANIEIHSNAWPLKNINRLHRSLVKLKPKFFNDNYWKLFLKAYSKH